MPLPAHKVATSPGRSAMQNANGNVVAFSGSSMNVDHAGHVSQHDVVYLRPPTEGADGMPIGDGDLGAMVWCPGHLQLQMQKTDLWADPPTAAREGGTGLEVFWRQPSAGRISLHSEPALMESPRKFEQRLSLYSGIITLQSETDAGSCQATVFASATTGVIVIHYHDQTLRNAKRWIDVDLWREAHLFALGEYIGILQAFPDRRYALLARVVGRQGSARMVTKQRARLNMPDYRSGGFTVYVTAATAPSNGDPVSMAKSRIQAAMDKGFETLLAEQRQHWSLFWQKSFVRLNGPAREELPDYLENLWHLGLYHLASCSRGHSAPLPNGGLWLHDGDERTGAALYEGAMLRQMIAPLLPSNHLELTVPHIETYHRLLPELAAHTSCDFGLGGARIPGHFNRTGDAFSERRRQAIPSRAPAVPSYEPDSPEALLAALNTSVPFESEETPPEPEPFASPGDGLAAALLLWEAYRYVPDPTLLRSRVYPLLRAAATFALDFAGVFPDALDDGDFRAQLDTALRALIWASAELNVDADRIPEWGAGWQALSGSLMPYQQTYLRPFGMLTPEQTEPYLHQWLAASRQLPQGFLACERDLADLAQTGELCAGITSLLLREEGVAQDQDETLPTQLTEGFRALTRSVLRVFPGLPASWSGAFVLAAPGGFRISAEAHEGQAVYVAIHSLLGGTCHMGNPWGPGNTANVRDGHEIVLTSEEATISIETKPGGIYLVERPGFAVSKAARIRLGGRRNEKPKRWEGHSIGLD